MKDQLSPFDFVASICKGGKDDIMPTEDEEKQYNAFIVNRALAHHQDCIFLVNEINIRPHLPERLQYDFLRFTLRPRKRYSKWSKKTSHEDLEIVKEYYGYSNEKAAAIINLLSPDDISKMKRKLDRGGRVK